MKKFISVLAAVVLVLSLSVSVFAFEGEANIVLCAGNSVTWTNEVSEPVTVNADGTYTLKLSGISIDEEAATVIYMKDAAVEAQEATATNLPADIQILTKEIKINGSPVEVTEGYATGLSNGVFDVCWYNIWATNQISIEGIGEITDIEVTFEVVSAGAAAEEPASEATVEPSTDAETDKPADSTEAPAKTGIALAALPMVIAAAAAAISKKR